MTKITIYVFFEFPLGPQGPGALPAVPGARARAIYILRLRPCRRPLPPPITLPMEIGWPKNEKHDGMPAFFFRSWWDNIQRLGNQLFGDWHFGFTF